MITNNTYGWFQSGTGSVVESSGNNHVGGNGGSIGTLTNVGLQYVPAESVFPARSSFPRSLVVPPKAGTQLDSRVRGNDDRCGIAIAAGCRPRAPFVVPALPSSSSRRRGPSLDSRVRGNDDRRGNDSRPPLPQRRVAFRLPE